MTSNKDQKGAKAKINGGNSDVKQKRKQKQKNRKGSQLFVCAMYCGLFSLIFDAKDAF